MHTVHKFHWFSTETTSTGIYEAYQHSQIREPTQYHACIAFQLHLQHGVAARNFGNKDRNIMKFMQHDRFCFEWFYVMQHCHPQVMDVVWQSFNSDPSYHASLSSRWLCVQDYAFHAMTEWSRCRITAVVLVWELPRLGLSSRRCQ